MTSYDEWLEAPYMRQDSEPEVLEDEGLLIVQSAIQYLQPRADFDHDEQLTGEYEALCILVIAGDEIKREYECHFCGTPINRRRDKYCSKNCYTADREGY